MVVVGGVAGFDFAAKCFAILQHVGCADGGELYGTTKRTHATADRMAAHIHVHAFEQIGVYQGAACVVKNGAQLARAIYADVQAAFSYTANLNLLVHVVGAAHIHARDVAQHIADAVGLAHVDFVAVHLVVALVGGHSDGRQFGVGIGVAAHISGLSQSNPVTAGQWGAVGCVIEA